jgi:hypothetical protein
MLWSGSQAAMVHIGRRLGVSADTTGLASSQASATDGQSRARHGNGAKLRTADSSERRNVGDFWAAD